MKRVGLPRALSSLQHYPQWRTFFEILGAELVISPATNRDILAAGSKIVADVTCLPVKVYAGHLSWLRDHGDVEAVFTPAIWNLAPDAFHCAKFKALPDMMKSCVPNCPPLLDIEVNRWRKRTQPNAFLELGKQFTRDAKRIEHAWTESLRAAAAFRNLLVAERLTYPEALARFYPDAWATPEWKRLENAELTVALAGHSYCLYDDYINHNLIANLSALGVCLVMSEMLSDAEARAGIDTTTLSTRWFYEQMMSGAAGHYLQHNQVDGVVTVLAFGCGPDSTMVETITRRAHEWQRTVMNLVLDEHGSSTGILTRLEAFVDMLARQKQKRRDAKAVDTSENLPSPALRAASPRWGEAGQQSPSPQRGEGTGMRGESPALQQSLNVPAILPKRPIVGFPRMGTTHIPLNSLFRGIKAQVELGQPISNHTVALGARHSPEFVCTPYKYILGNLMELLDIGATHVLYVEGPDLCRSGCFAQMMRDTLHDVGYKDFSLVTTAIFQGGIFNLPKFLRQFTPDVTWRDIVREFRLAVAKMRALDEIERQVQYVRPREVTQGSVEKVWEEAQRRIDDVWQLPHLDLVKRDVLQKIKHVPQDPTKRPVIIATTGEYYAILDPFFNLDLERELGKLGAEVHRTLMMSQWVEGTMVLDALGIPHERDVAKAARPYLRADVSGEAFVTLGRTVLEAQRGADGAIETMPFTCIPEIVALNILPRLSRELNIPIATFIFDEQSGRAGMRTRLEAFVDLLYRRRAMREAGETPLPLESETLSPVCHQCPIVATCHRAPTETLAETCMLTC